MTKLDVLDGLDIIKVCVGYAIDGEETNGMPVDSEQFESCEPIYEDVPGWHESTVGVKSFEDLPENARDYVARIETLVEIPIDIISTGPDREQTIIKTHPFD